MREFTTFGAAAMFLEAVALEVKDQHKALERAARVVEKEAKSLIGEYQPQAGPFAPWAELADATKDDRVRQGFEENEPLLRTGEMRDSIHHVVDYESAVIGSDDEKAEWQELGTNRIPPRSFLGGAAVNKADVVANILGDEVVFSLTGQHVYKGSMPIK